jgi:sarcosine oxidase
VVLGLGALGAAACYRLARRCGREVLGLEQFELLHARGGSHDHSRIIRLSYHTPRYVRLARQAYQAWAELEGDCGQPLIVRTGGLDLGRPGSAIPLQDYERSMSAAEVAFERLDAGEIARRWPVWRLPEDTVGLYQADAGIAPALRCMEAHLRMAREHGATLLERTGVLAIRDAGQEIVLETEAGRLTCGTLVLAAGAWTNRALAHLGQRLPLTVTQEQVTYFAPRDLEPFRIGRFPLWIWMDDPCFYGFPVYGEAGVKVAQDVGGDQVTVETRSFEPDPRTLTRVRGFLERSLPAALGPELYTKTCLYTMAPDRDFILGALPGHPRVLLAVDSAHGFKFAALIGRILAELALDGTSASEIAGFETTREVLWISNPPRNFMT